MLLIFRKINMIKWQNKSTSSGQNSTRYRSKTLHDGMISADLMVLPSILISNKHPQLQYICAMLTCKLHLLIIKEHEALVPHLQRTGWDPSVGLVVWPPPVCLLWDSAGSRSRCTASSQDRSDRPSRLMSAPAGSEQVRPEQVGSN